MDDGFTEIILPTENANEASLIDGISVYPAETLTQVIDHIAPKENNKPRLTLHPLTKVDGGWHESTINLEDIKRPRKC